MHHSLHVFYHLSITFTLCVIYADNVANDGFSNTDGSVYKAESPFVDINNGDDSKNYVVFDEHGVDHDLPLLIWWTEDLFPHYGGKSDKFLVQCGDVSCYSTKNKKYRNNPDTRAFIFYGTDMEPEHLPLPRKSHHEWALFHEESPLNNYMLSHQPFIELFNHTATFRNESDYPLTTQNIYHLSYLTERKPLPVNEKNMLKEKKSFAPVLYVQSHCEVPSDRDRYIQELMKYIDVDSYGKCLHNKDLPEHLRDPAPNFEVDEFLDFISQYKFHLAFENANCEDYMTEKLMRPLFVGSVPIYKGSPEAADWMPNNHSIIMVDKFTHPEDLATFIKKIDEDDSEYEKYLSYKLTGITNEFLKDHLNKRPWHVNDNSGFDFFRGFECHVCQNVNERISVERAHQKDPDVPLLPPKMANNFHLGCPEPFPSIGGPDDIPPSDIWMLSDWVGQYWADYDRGTAVKNMILAGEKRSNKFMEYYRKVFRDKKTGV